MSKPTSSNVEDLLAQAAWIRALAGRLSSDPLLAEDLAQDTCVSALEKMPDGPVHLRAWLAAILRNRLRQRVRGDRRRIARERQASKTERLPSASDLVVRVETHRELMRAVLELDEPYRTTLILRFLEELPPRAIAKRQGIPVKTVDTRLERGIAKLRKRLDKSHGGSRHAWVLALQSLPQLSKLSVIGAVLMSAKSWIVASAIALAATVFVVWPTGHDAGDVDARAGHSLEERDETDVPVKEPIRVGSTPQRVNTAPTTHDKKPEATATCLVEGRVTDANARPVAEVPLSFVPGVFLPRDKRRDRKVAATSDATGNFALRVTVQKGHVVAASPKLTTLFAATVSEAAQQRERVVVVVPAVPLRGKVRDTRGRPIARAQVRVLLPANLRSGLDVILDHSRTPEWHARSGSQGDYELPTAGYVAGAQLLVTAEGYRSNRVDFPRAARDAVDFVLEDATQAGEVLRGVVIDALGIRVDRAHVALGRNLVRTDRSGNFEFSLDEKTPGKRLVAIKEGHLPAIAEVSSENGWSGFVTLQFQGRALTITGKVVTAKGAALPGAKVWLDNPTTFGRVADAVVPIEGVLAGATSHRALRNKLREQTDASSIANTIRNTPTATWNWVRTDESGRFRIEGLQRRAYVLSAMDPATLLRARSNSVDAGTVGVEIRMPANGLVQQLRGRVVDRTGRPVQGVRVQPKLTAIAVQSGPIREIRGDDLPATQTDKDGRFVLANVARESAYLSVTGEQILPTTFGRKEGGIAAACNGRTQDVEIEVSVRVHIKVELAGRSADGLQVLDKDGQPLPITVFSSGSRMQTTRLRLATNASPTCAVPDSATHVVLVRGKKEVARQPLRLVAGKVNRVVF